MTPEEVRGMVEEITPKIVDVPSAALVVKQLSCVPKAAAMLAIALISDRLYASKEFQYLLEAIDGKIVNDRMVALVPEG